MNSDRIEGSWKQVRGKAHVSWRSALASVGAAGLALAGVAGTGCATDRGEASEARTHERAGEYVDDSVITAKVKAALLEEPSLKSLQISVKTYKDVVQLSGFVDSAQAAHRAGEVAKRVHGVASVRNDLIVK